MPDLMEAPQTTAQTTGNENTDVLDRLGAKSDAKITGQKKEEKPTAPTAENMTGLKAANEIIGDDKPKEEDRPGQDKPKTELEGNQEKIEAERQAGLTAADAEKPTGEAKPETKKIEKNWFEEEDTTASAANTDKPSNDADALKKYETQAKEYEDLVGDPFVAAYLGSKKSGKDLQSFISEVNGVDVKALTDEQVWERELQSANLTPEEISTEMEDFKALTPYNRKKKVEPVRSKLDAERAQKLQRYAADNTAAAAQKDIITQKFVNEKEQYLTTKKGKVEMGIEMTPARLQELSGYMDSFDLQRSDKTIDVARIARIGMLEKYHKLMLQNAYQKGLNDAKIEAFKEVARPSREDSGLRIPPTQVSAAKQDVENFRKELRS